MADKTVKLTNKQTGVVVSVSADKVDRMPVAAWEKTPAPKKTTTKE